MQETIPTTPRYVFNGRQYVNVGGSESPFWWMRGQQGLAFSHEQEQLAYARRISHPQWIEEDYIAFNPIKPLVETKVEPFSQIESADTEFACYICMDGFLEDEPDKNETMCKLQCKHTMCMVCTERILQRNNLCPMCREPIAQICVQNENIKRLIDAMICD